MIRSVRLAVKPVGLSPTITSIYCQTASRSRTAERLYKKIESSVMDVETGDLREIFRVPKHPTRNSVKEVIQPQVPLRLPCYDFAPVTTLAFGGLAP
jgi:hypothetical protein